MAKYDYTMLSTFLTCRRKYYFRIVRGIVGKAPPVAAEFGRCIHHALDVWYTEHDINKAIELFKKEYVESPEDDKRTHAVGEKILRLYAQKYEHEAFKVLKTEIGFDLPITSNISLIGRIDKIIDWDGAIYVMDHKTTSRLGYEFFYKIKPNMQFDGYIWAAKNMGYKCSGVVMDAILVAKGLLVPAQLSRLNPLARDISTRSDKEIQEYIDTVIAIVVDIERGNFYPNTESCCNFIECPYRKICKEEPQMHERIIEMDYKVEPWDPLKHAKDGVSNA